MNSGKQDNVDSSLRNALDQFWNQALKRRVRSLRSAIRGMLPATELGWLTSGGESGRGAGPGRRMPVAGQFMGMEWLETRALMSAVITLDNDTPQALPTGPLKTGQIVHLKVNLSSTDPQDQVPEGETLVIFGGSFSKTINTYGLQPVDIPITFDGEIISAYINGADGDESATVQIGGAVIVKRVHTDDSKNLVVDYNVSGNDSKSSFPLDVYRSDVPTYSKGAPSQVAIANLTITGSDASDGDHSITIQSSGKYHYAIANPLRPDPTDEYVVAVADANGAIDSNDQFNPSSAEFRIYVAAYIEHGYSITLSSTQRQFQGFANDLTTYGDYDYAVAMPWESATADPTVLSSSAVNLEKMLIADSVSKTSGPDDIVDVNLIGWSRGGVLVGETAVQLGVDEALGTVPHQLSAGYLMETLIDPHPANNNLSAFLGFNNDHSAHLDDTSSLGERAATLATHYILGQYRNFQSVVSDPDVFIPSNVTSAVEFYQRNDASGFSPLITNTESLLNLWGVDPSNVIDNSADGLISYPILDSQIGHSEIMYQTFADEIFTNQTLQALGIQPFNDPLVITVQPPSNVTAGSSFTVTVTAENPDGTVNTSFTDPITITNSYNNSAPLGGATTVNAVNGIATFTLNETTAGYQTFQASTKTLSSVYSNGFNVSAAAATHFGLDTPIASPQTVNGGFTTYVDALDPYGNVDTGFNGPVTLALGNGPSGISFSGAGTTTAYNGRVSFYGSFNKIGFGDTLIASSPGLTSYTTTPIDVLDAAVVTTAPPTSVVAGAPFGLTVAAEDANGVIDTSYNGNITLNLSNFSGGSGVYTLGGTLTATAVNGIATFSGLTESQSGSFGLFVAAPDLVPVSVLFNVTAKAATKLSVTSAPPIVTSGVTFATTVAALDSFGNVDTNFTGTITLALGNNPGSTTLGGTLTATAYNGVATFSYLYINAPGNGYTLTASTPSLTSSTSGPINVTPSGAAIQWSVYSGPYGAQTAGVAFGMTLNAVDGNGNVDTQFNGPVTLSLASNPGAATLGGTVTANAVNGVVTFTDLTVNTSGSGYTIQATGSGLASTVTYSFNIAAAAATQLAFVPSSSLVLTNQAFGPVVNAEDPFGNIDTTFTGTVSLSVANNPGGASLNGTIAVAVVNGVATFPGVSISASGVGYTLQASCAGLTSATSAAFNVSDDQIAFTTQPPTTVVANAPFDFTVQVHNGAGAIDTGFNGNLTATLVNFSGGRPVLAGNLTVTAVSGVATFTGLTIDRPGQYSITVSGTGVAVGNSLPFTSIFVPTQVRFDTVLPPNITVNSPFTVSASVLDAANQVDTDFNGVVSVSIASNPGSSVLGGTLTGTASNGIVTFTGLTLSAVGSGYTLAVSSGSLAVGTGQSFNVTPLNAATRLAFTPQPPASVFSGAGFGFAVTAADDFGGVDSTFNGNVTITLDANPFAGTIGGTLTVPAVNGIATFTGLTLIESGAFTISAQAAGLVTTRSAPIAVNPAPASDLTVQTPNLILVNAPFDLRVQALGNLGGVDTHFTGPVTISVLNSAGTLAGNLTVNAVAGVATFRGLTLNAPGNVIFRAVCAGLNSGQSVPTAVTADQLVVTTQPTNAPVGAQGGGFGFVVTVKNGAGAVDASYNGPVSIDPTSSSSPIHGQITVNAIAGVATFSGLYFDQSGYNALAITAPNITPTYTNPFLITSSPAVKLQVITAPPASVTVGQTFEFDVAAVDALGNVDDHYTGPITIGLANNPASGSLGGTHTINAIHGVARFTNLTLNTSAAGYTLSASASSLTSTTTLGFDVSPVGTATRLVVTTQPPATVAAGVSFDVTVTATDGLGNVDAGFAGIVTISEIGGTPLQGILSVVASGGTAVFSGLSINQAGGGYVLSASGGTGIAPALSQPIQVDPLQAVALKLLPLPGPLFPGVPFDQLVVGVDTYGNVDPTFHGDVVLVLANNPSGATLLGPASTTAVNHFARFSSLVLSKPGAGYTVTATSSGLAPATSTPFNVTANQALITSAPPASPTAGAGFGFTILILDNLGATDTSFNGPVTLSLVNLGTNPASLNGTLTVNAVLGVVTFTGISIDAAGTYSITVSGSGVTPTSTGVLNVRPALSSSSLTGLAGPTVSGGAGSVVLSGKLAVSSPPTTETVSISVGGVTQAAPIAADGSFSSTFDLSSFAVGSYVITYQYLGDTDFAPLTITSQHLIVVIAPTATTLSVNPGGSANAGTAVTLTASVAVTSGSAHPTGPVVFLDGSTTLGTATLNASGAATFSTTTLAPGAHLLSAAYQGAFAFGASSSSNQSLTILVVNTTTHLSVSTPDKSIAGTAEYFTATVTPSVSAFTPTGIVAFVEGTVTLGTGTLSHNIATFSSTSLTVGLHNINAVYLGGTGVNGSTSNPLAVHVGTDHQRFVNQLYIDLFKRQADPSGLDAWSHALDTGTTYAQVATLITSSREYDGDVVDAFYFDYLGRHAETNGLNAWINLMQTGLNAEVIRAGILGSDEYFNRTGPNHVNGTDATFINALYVTFLGRAPEAGGLAAWEGLLGGNPAKRQTVASGISNSDENRTDIITGFYQTYLHRDPDPTGLTAWKGQLASGVSQPVIITFFVTVPEYMQRYGIA